MKEPRKPDSCKILLQAFSCLLFVTGGISIIAGNSLQAELSSFHELVPLGVSRIYVTFIVAGVLTFISTILCYVSSFNRNKWILLAVSVFLGITLCTEIGAAISGDLFKTYRAEVIERKMRYSLRDYYMFLIRNTWDALQRKFQCCGVDGYQDWLTEIQAMPMSCCRIIPESVNTTTCNQNSTTLYSQGCFGIFADYIIDRSDVISKTGILVALLQISGLCCAFVAYCIIRYVERKKKIERVKVDLVTDERLGVFSI